MQELFGLETLNIGSGESVDIGIKQPPMGTTQRIRL